MVDRGDPRTLGRWGELLPAHLRRRRSLGLDAAAIEVWEVPNTVVHAKVVIADDVVSFGTLNHDAWALYRSAELLMIAKPAGRGTRAGATARARHRPLQARQPTLAHARTPHQLAERQAHVLPVERRSGGRRWGPRSSSGRWANAGDRSATMILPKVRDPRFVTIRRGGTLTDSDHQRLALWAASCAEHALELFESAQPEDPRPRQAIECARAWVRGEVKMTQAREAAGHAMAAARDLGQRGMPRTLPARRGSSRTSPRTNSVRPPMQSRLHVAARRRARATAQGDSSASGSVTGSRRRFASSYLTTSGCETTSAGRCLTAERASGLLPEHADVLRE